MLEYDFTFRLLCSCKGPHWVWAQPENSWPNNRGYPYLQNLPEFAEYVAMEPERNLLNSSMQLANT